MFLYKKRPHREAPSPNGTHMLKKPLAIYGMSGSIEENNTYVYANGYRSILSLNKIFRVRKLCKIKEIWLFFCNGTRNILSAFRTP